MSLSGTVFGPVGLVPSVGVPAIHSGWTPAPGQILRKALMASAVGLYFPGTDFPNVFGTTSGVTDKSVGDYSKNGNHLSNHGATPAAKYFTSGLSAYYDVPFTGDQLLAAGTSGQFTILSFGKFNAASGCSVNNYNSTTVNGVALGRMQNAGATYLLRTSYASETDPTDLSFATDGNTGSAYEMLTGTWRYDAGGMSPVREARFYRQVAGGSLQTSSAQTLPAAIGGALNFRIGRTVGAQFTGAVDIPGVAFFNRALTAGEIQNARDDLAAFLTTFGITV